MPGPWVPVPSGGILGPSQRNPCAVTGFMSERTRKLYIKTHGCQMNEYDSARIRDLLATTHGLEPTENPEDADVLLLNTCAIRESAQEKVFHQLGRWRRLKERNPDLVIGVGGCVASQEGEAIEIGRASCRERGKIPAAWARIAPGLSSHPRANIGERY